MIKQTYIMGGNIRRVIIDGKDIKMITPGVPEIALNLANLSAQKDKLDKLKLKDDDLKLLENLNKLGSESEIANDIKKDFQSTGWRLMKQDDSL